MRSWHSPKWEEERGFTLPEVLMTVAILGILIAIAITIWLGVIEQRRVDAATNQLVSDLRLAHSSATNQLTDWRIVVVYGRDDEDEGADYYLIKLGGTYENGAPPPVIRRIPRTFPANVWVKKVVTSSGTIVDDKTAEYWVAPWVTAPSPMPDTRTIEFNSDGTMRYIPPGPSGSVCVTIDESPRNRIITSASASRTRVELDSDCDTS